MKRLFALILVLVFLPLFCLSESAYSPALSMTMQDFVSKYNMNGVPFGSSLKGLERAYNWSAWDKYHVAWFEADSKSSVTILLETTDPAFVPGFLTSGVDRIQIYITNDRDFPALISVASRCLSMFASNVLGLDTSYYYIAQIIKDYYENNCFEKKLTYQRQLESGGNIYLCFFNDSGYYYFDIVTGSDL